MARASVRSHRCAVAMTRASGVLRDAVIGPCSASGPDGDLVTMRAQSDDFWFVASARR